jgi:hypothetical protein
MSPMPLTRHCDRREPDCGQPAVAHFWPFSGDPPLNFFACPEHHQQALDNLGEGQMHELGPNCGMPETEFDPIRNRCVHEGGLGQLEEEWIEEGELQRMEAIGG